MILIEPQVAHSSVNANIEEENNERVYEIGRNSAFTIWKSKINSIIVLTESNKGHQEEKKENNHSLDSQNDINEEDNISNFYK